MKKVVRHNFCCCQTNQIFSPPQFYPTTNNFDERVVDYLEAQACMDQKLAKLIFVKIIGLKGLKPQLLLIKLLLVSSPKLETLFV